MSRHILLGVTGSIAAFKAVALASTLLKEGLVVRAVLTRAATRFITPLTFETITGNAVAVEVWDETPGASRMGHIELAKWADLLVVAPASADAIARLALGLADDMLTSVALTSTAPLLLAPAMESTMWQHPATAQHIRTLEGRGARLIGPTSGRLASGASGEGRMAEPDEIVAAIRRALDLRRDLSGRRVLVTAGPTYESIDPVRFIGNRSSGKMGYAMAREARDRGALVTLVSGPTALTPPAQTEIVCVESQREMRDAVIQRAPNQDVIVMAAAVADFRPAAASGDKLKREGSMALHLESTEDIAAEAARTAPGAIHVGFALETSDLADRARQKMKRKRQDLVVANALTPDHNPFGSETNRVVLIAPDSVTEMPEAGKDEVARAIWDRVVTLLAERREPSGQ